MKNTVRFWTRVSTMLLVIAAGATPIALHAQEQDVAAPSPAQKNAEDILGNIVVVAGASRQLPKVAVIPSLASDLEDVTVRSVVRRDLDLCGEFEVVDDRKAPEGLYLSDSPVDVAAWAKTGAESLVRVMGKPLAGGRAEIRGQAYFIKNGPNPVFDKRFEIAVKDVRIEAHRLADVLIGALTGQNGSFASQMAFTSGAGTLRRAYVMDADGHNARAVSAPDQIALSPAFGPGGELFFSASQNRGEYQVYSASAGPLAQSVKGSVYGLTFSKDKSKVAVSIGVLDTIQVFTGPSLTKLEPVSKIGMALQPTFTPSGKIAYVGEGKNSQRVFVGEKAISPDGIMAAAPAFCSHPDGVRLVYMVGVGKNTDLVVTNENGGGMVRLTQDQGQNGYPACSPDGRLIAFFSTRTRGEGPGIYIMRIDGGRPKRVSTLLGDSLRWDALPLAAPKELPIGAAATP